MSILLAILAATVAWFVVAAVLFFNPIVDPIYRSQESMPAVRALPQGPTTIVRILTAVLVQCVLWAVVYVGVAPALPQPTWLKGLAFGGIIAVVKVIPRDIDRVLLTTYPGRRMTIELVNGVVCAAVVGWTFAWLL